MKNLSKMSLMVVCLGILSINTQLTAHSSSDQKCATNVKKLIKHNCAYQTVSDVLSSTVISDISSLLYNVQTVGSTAYAALLAYAVALAATLPTGNVIIADSNGNVAVDVAQGGTNTYANYQSGSIAPNQMSNIAVIDAQAWPCGLGVQSVYSNTLPGIQNVVAKRLNAIPFSNVGSNSYLNSLGTVLMSVDASSICVPLP